MPFPFRSNQPLGRYSLNGLKYGLCQSVRAKCHRSILNRHYHLAEVETHRSVPIPFRSDQPFGSYSRKRLKLRIVPIAIVMCQVPPIDSQQAPSPSRGQNTSISASLVPMRPAVWTLFAEWLNTRTGKGLRIMRPGKGGGGGRF